MGNGGCLLMWFGSFLCLQRNLLEEDSDEEEDFFL